MKYFLDTEFREFPNEIHLISLGIIAEDGRTFYVENSDFPEELFDEWLMKNVRPHLLWYDKPRARNIHDCGIGDIHFIREELLKFIGNDIPEFWGYYADYDWVVFCWIFGRMIELPEGWPMYCKDVKQLMDMAGNPEKPQQSNIEHNALADALYTKELYYWIQGHLSEVGRDQGDVENFAVQRKRPLPPSPSPPQTNLFNYPLD